MAAAERKDAERVSGTRLALRSARAGPAVRFAGLTIIEEGIIVEPAVAGAGAREVSVEVTFRAGCE